MKQEIMAIFCIVLIISSTFAGAQDLGNEEIEFDEREAGEAIIVEVKGQEPQVVPSNLIEDDDVPVYLHLKGSTLGSLAVPDIIDRNRLTTVRSGDIFYGIPPIKRVTVTENKAKDREFIKGSPRYRRPKVYSLDNLGYLVVRLKQIEKEEDVPEEIILNLTARIEFDTERSFGIGRQTFVLNEQQDEDAWFNNPEELARSTFFSGRGYIRAVEIGENNADFFVYDSRLRNIGTTVNLAKGQTSRHINLGDSGLIIDSFRLKVDDVANTQGKKAQLELRVNGVPENRVIREGDSLYDGSKWTVRSIITESAEKNQVREKVILKGPSGTKEISRVTNDILLTPAEKGFEKSKNNIIETTIKSIDDLKDVIMKYYGIAQGSITAGKDYATIQISEAARKPQTIKVRRGTTLRELLKTARVGFRILQNNALEIFEKGAEEIADPCMNIARMDLTEIAGFSQPNKEDLAKEEKVKIYCEAIRTFKDLKAEYSKVVDEDGLLFGVKADYWIGKSYEALGKLEIGNVNKAGATKNMLSAYKAAMAGNYFGEKGEIGDIVKAAEQNLEGTVEYTDNVIQEDDNFIDIRLAKVISRDTSDVFAMIEVDGSIAKKFFIGDQLIEPEWFIRDIKKDRIMVGREIKDEQNRLFTSEEMLSLGQLRNIGNHRLVVSKIELNNQVIVTILPGSGKSVFSESSFDVHIPIEKRAIKLPLFTDKIDDEIEKTEELIAKLDKIIDKLDNLLKTWKAVCLGTFAVLTIKNSFGIFGGGATRITARKAAIEGTEDNPGWRAFCRKETGPNKLYNTFDDCIADNLDSFNTEVDRLQKVYDTTKNDFKPGMQEIDGIDFKKVTAFEKDFGRKIISDDDKREFLRISALKKACEGYKPENNEKLKGSNPSQCNNINTRYNSLSSTYSFINEQYGAADNTLLDKKLNSFADWKRDKAGADPNTFAAQKDFEINKVENEIKLGLYLSGIIEKDKKGLNSDAPITTSKIEKIDNDFYWTGYPGSYIKLEKKDGDNLITSQMIPIAGKIPQKIYFKQPNIETKTEITANTIDTKDKIAYLADNTKIDVELKEGEYFIKGKKGIKVKSNSQLFSDIHYNTKYAPTAKLECYPEGVPYCVPVGNGNYAKVLEFFKDGSPKTMQIWNVGQDGLLCNDDDIPLEKCSHQSALQTNECASTYNNAMRQVERARRNCQNCDSRYRISGITELVTGSRFECSTAAASNLASSTGGSCTDVMEPNDCRLMFGVCDPVMCPSSRFNLGGSWPVTNVVQTGIIGSLFLGLHNFDTYEPLPICVTGISAGLKNIRSILQGYSSCLKTAKVEGRSVGICDKVRSVFLCQMLWREAIALFNVQGGIFDLIAKKLFSSGEDGGGEYLNFKTNFQNIGSSVNYFTTQYAASAFAAYNAKSLDEIGGEVCKAAIFGKAPGIGEFLEQLSEPEDPPQFTAIMSEAPYSESQRQSQYSVFYHIYGGSQPGQDKELQYSVYMRSPLGRIKYMTETCDTRRAKVARGGFASATVDCIADSEFTEVCVEIGGKQNCGFGKVSTDFGLNYVNDLLVQDEAKRRINSAKECVPDYVRTSPSMGSLVLPHETGLLATGIVRACSIANPGQGTNAQDWAIVGTCGNDDSGKFIGSCWLDKRTLSLNDLSRRQELEKEFKTRGINAREKSLGIERGLNEETTAKLFEEAGSAEQKPEKFSGMLIAASKYNEIINGIDLGSENAVNIIAKAMLKKGIALFRLVLEKPVFLELDRTFASETASTEAEHVITQPGAEKINVPDVQCNIGQWAPNPCKCGSETAERGDYCCGTNVIMTKECVPDVFTQPDSPPAITTLSFNNLVDETYITSTLLPIKLVANDDKKVKFMKIQENQNTAEWQTYETEFNYILSIADGTKNIKVQVMDDTGHVSNIVPTRIILDGTPPTVNIQSPSKKDGIQIAEGEDLLITARFTDATSGIKLRQYFDNDMPIPECPDNKDSCTYFTAGRPGLHQIKVTAEDGAGNTGEDNINNLYVIR